MRKLFPLLVYSLFFSTLCIAEDYYVDFKDGSNTNSGDSIEQAWKHAPGSVNVSGVPSTISPLPGDRIIFKRGVTYGDSITIKSSGTELLSGTNGIIVTSRRFKVSGKNLASYDISSGDHIFINGEGLFPITGVSGDEITLSGEVRVLDKPGNTNTFRDGMLHVGETGVAFFIARCVSYISSPDWGSGKSTITGGLRTSNLTSLIIDGGKDRGFEIIGGSGAAVYIPDGARGLFISGLVVHDSCRDSALPGIYIRNATYACISNSEINNNGTLASPAVGNDGIYVVSDSKYITVSGCDIHHNLDDGIHFARAAESYIQYCAIHDQAAPYVHADGIQLNSPGDPWHVTIRYNRIYNNGSPTDWEDASVSCYYNAFYDSNPGAEGNIGIRYKKTTDKASIEILNNIFAYNSIYAISTQEDYGSVKIINNIFWENKDLSGNESGPDINIRNPSAASYIHHNMYVRRENKPDNGKVIEWGGSTYRYSATGTYSVLNAVQNSIPEPIDSALNDLGIPADLTTTGDLYFDQETGSDITFWESENRSNLKFTPAGRTSPQVSAGRNLGLLYDMYGERIDPNNVTIGAVQLNQIAPIDPPDELTVVAP